MGGCRPAHRVREPGLNGRPGPTYRLVVDQAEFDDLIGTLAGQQRLAVATEFPREKP